MRHLFVPSILVLVAVGTWAAFAAEDFAPDAAKAEPKAKAKKKADPNRLPAPWGQLELSGEQKDKIYAVQKTSRAKLDPIDNELKKLREQVKGKQAERKAVQDDLRAQMLAVLTEVQRAQLLELEAKAEAKAEMKKKRADPKDSRAAPPSKKES